MIDVNKENNLEKSVNLSDKKEINMEILKKYMWHLIVAAGYLLIVFFFTKDIWDFVKLVIGVLLGIIFIIADEEYLYKFYQDDSDLTKNLIDENILAPEPEEDYQFATAVQEIEKVEKKQSKFIVTHSTLYLLSLIPTALFVFTSSGSFLAVGMISGMFLFLLTEMYQTLKMPTTFFKKYFSLVRIAPTQQNMSGIFVITSLFFILLHFFVIL
ncbi:MAG: hypothetical protein HN981_02815 [Candidatus Pacebacteria bacterium]|jgi:hypothetical protein|nr:hypothetical protein [Candidatus Paceibacterota bacterium]MBT4652577.1 hypothetical protein [Candidatus Paceibacterota bacterium]MBT6756404.1 hypothetical protein [Candidatus Paceibacterota bacterium]MBT6921302.1 hypothetical protein [Candidatus Paceibacterota bacterium]